MVIAYVLIGLVIVALVGLITSVRILKQYERGVQFRLGGAPGSGVRRRRKTTRATLARERSFGRLSRSFLLPEDIDEVDITTTRFQQGQLTVSVPRPKVETPRRVETTTS